MLWSCCFHGCSSKLEILLLKWNKQKCLFVSVLMAGLFLINVVFPLAHFNESTLSGLVSLSSHPRQIPSHNYSDIQIRENISLNVVMMLKSGRTFQSVFKCCAICQWLIFVWPVFSKTRPTARQCMYLSFGAILAEPVGICYSTFLSVGCPAINNECVLSFGADWCLVDKGETVQPRLCHFILTLQLKWSRSGFYSPAF